MCVWGGKPGMNTCTRAFLPVLLAVFFFGWPHPLEPRSILAIAPPSPPPRRPGIVLHPMRKRDITRDQATCASASLRPSCELQTQAMPAVSLCVGFASLWSRPVLRVVSMVQDPVSRACVFLSNVWALRLRATVSIRGMKPFLSLPPSFPPSLTPSLKKEHTLLKKVHTLLPPGAPLPLAAHALCVVRVRVSRLIALVLPADTADKQEKSSTCIFSSI
jgi:hypothetical protein